MDQASKIFIRANMDLYDSIPLINNIFHITYIENPGAAFGMLAGKKELFIILTVIISVVMCFLFRSFGDDERKEKIFLMMALSGTAGNFLDRVMKGTVTDFFDFRIWPVFNVADSFITVGLVLLAFSLIKQEIKDHE